MKNLVKLFLEIFDLDNEEEQYKYLVDKKVRIDQCIYILLYDLKRVSTEQTEYFDDLNNAKFEIIDDENIAEQYLLIRRLVYQLNQQEIDMLVYFLKLSFLGILTYKLKLIEKYRGEIDEITETRITSKEILELLRCEIFSLPVDVYDPAKKEEIKKRLEEYKPSDIVEDELLNNIKIMLEIPGVFSKQLGRVVEQQRESLNYIDTDEKLFLLLESNYNNPTALRELLKFDIIRTIKDLKQSKINGQQAKEKIIRIIQECKLTPEDFLLTENEIQNIEQAAQNWKDKILDFILQTVENLGGKIHEELELIADFIDNYWLVEYDYTELSREKRELKELLSALPRDEINNLIIEIHKIAIEKVRSQIYTAFDKLLESKEYTDLEEFIDDVEGLVYDHYLYPPSELLEKLVTDYLREHNIELK